MKLLRLLPLVVCLGIGAVAVAFRRAPASAPAAAPGVARVGEVVLTESELRRRMAEVDPCDGKSGGCSESEREEAIRAWAYEQLMYQEGLRQGLDRTDPVVRQRIVTAVYENEVLAQTMTLTPTEEELKSFYAANPALFETKARVTGYHLSLTIPPSSGDSERTALDVATALDGDVERLDACIRRCEAEGITVRAGATGSEVLTKKDVERSLGRKVAEAFFSEEARQGAVRVESGATIDLVRVTRYLPSTLPPFESVRSDVQRAFRNQATRDRYHAVLASLAAKSGADLPPGVIVPASGTR